MLLIINGLFKVLCNDIMQTDFLKTVSDDYKHMIQFYLRKCS
jgi:hypothetical protein